uniref:ZP domain-containing protein n=1 Tax=Cyprinus carpio TaxID=7962 RepID=A0A8C2AVC8_CYPCA
MFGCDCLLSLYNLQLHAESTTSSSDPCYDYNTLDEYWRDIRQNPYQYSGHDDTLVEWSGWYRLYLNGESAQMSEWCVSYVGCGGYTGLYLNGSHPTLEDGVVTREVLGSYMWWWGYSNQCGAYKSTSIQVKACPGDYYVYEFVKPIISAPGPTYCAVAFQSFSSDPCYNYESLDRPWRANNESGDNICDDSFSWNGWYRLFYYGMNIQMPETCVSWYSCNTYYTLWLNGPHPQIEDGVVTREVCGGSYWGGCCDYKTNPIRVKACPGNYYVYELVKPQIGCSGYCTDVSTISQVASTVSPDIVTGSSITLNYDPCESYNVLNNHWRSTLNYWSTYGYISDHDDTSIEWDGWYRLFINGSSAQMPEWCMSYMSCGGFSSLWLGGSHPRLEDGVATREIYGSYFDQCSHYRSDSIQVKACPGNYYVYKFTRPPLSIPAPVYCAVPFTTPSVDPCYSYTSLDEPWRATNNPYYNNNYYHNMCDYNVEWNGWYRMFFFGQFFQMPESCVNQGMCGTQYPLWLTSPHPQLEDGVVTRQVCASAWSGCCTYTSHPIRVKACPGNYYVYEFVKPMFCSAFCIVPEASNQSIPSVSTTTETIPPIESITPPITTTAPSVDPCYNYNVLDDLWRSTNNQHSSQIMCDTWVSWNGWYRLYIQGQSVQMPDTCVDMLSCGTHAPLWLNGGHPTVEDGVVTRDVCGHWSNNCCYFQSNPIKVKACPGGYYVYEFVRPSACSLAYCADARNINITSTTVMPETTTTTETTAETTLPAPSVDPCYNYNVLDDLWRSTNNQHSSQIMCDTWVSWNGWYRLYIQGQSVQMPDTCVDMLSCGTHAPLWLNGGHPTVEDGVVTRDVCGHWSNNCCYFQSNPIKVKACPGGYYVYEFVRPSACSLAYCADARNINITSTTVMPETTTTTETTAETTLPAPSVDPCYNYNVLDDLWRSTNNQHSSQIMCDTTVSWNGWYRLYIQGQSVQMPDTCVDMLSCGTHAPLWLNGGHPTVEDGVVTRDVCGHWSNNCCYFQSNPIKVKACPGGYYVYEFVRPSACSLAYCADARNINITSTTVMPETTTTTETTAETTLPAPSVDPCYNYNVLDDLWRSTNNQHSSQIMCDTTVSWNGWYRLYIQGQSVQMPDTCVDMLSCGTHAPLWLNGGHPTVEDGVVTRDVCGHWSNNCCYFQSNPIKVKACPGGYYVYEFVRPSACSLAYCADARNINITSTTVMLETSTTTETTAETTLPVNRNPCSELNCSDDERCGMKNGVYGCLCKKDQHRQQQHHDSFDFSETCESSSGSMSVSRCQLFEAGFPADVLHLNDPSCKGMVQNGRVEFHFDNDEHICGTNLLANGTHFIYSNCILGTPRSEDLISREKILKLSFSCVYPQTQTLSMNVEINPLESIVYRTLPAGEGRYQVRMIPYEDDEFTRPFTGRVDAELDQKMNVEVRVEGVDSRQFALVMDTCWATPVNDPDYSLRWDLILTECPNPNDDTVELLQNGVSTSSRFSFRMFIFTANSTKLYLHCAVHLCLLSSNRCSTDCNSGHQRRERRSLDFHDSASISLGPLMLSEGNTDKWIPEQVKASEASRLCGSLMLLLVPLMSFLILF